ncbi:hypothetical protein CEY00_Acc07503 [Actinidia chinensis var. chinensis]|uniref:Uncharacterized protein n=1 Tax=Actinidia chinensis var. chinensis TaxID=1590841 RepID=A0A2R6RCD7_ACTCC|nr:hypothetical protein CEY00_Acc07503 [Actinidia chinensis var. chinensis]
MSLALIQGYSSAEEEEEDINDLDLQNSSEDERNHDVSDYSSKPLFDLPKPSSNGGSSLPSAFAAFAEVSGRPEFLNNCVEDLNSSTAGGDDVGQRWRHGRKRNRKENKDLPAGAVMEAKAQLVGIHERVRSDIEGNTPSTSSVQPNSSSSSAQGGAKRMATATNPNAEDAAELLRMCVQCGIPKTYSSARGMVCPVCGDRPPVENSEPVKKKGSAIKDKEKSKRMKGQSSHATWKSETEMQLRQHFD